MNTIDDQLQVNTDPNINQLCTEYRRAYSDERMTYRVRESDETRFATWNGQSRDGKKHAKDLGRQPFPWEGASDTRIRLADEVCSFMVNLSTSAIGRAALNVAGVEASDHKAAIWDRCYAQTPRTINLQSLSGFLGVNAPQQLDALTAALEDEEEYIADLLVASNDGLTRTKALKHIREIVKNGETTFELPDMARNQAKIVALRPYHEILFPPETNDLQRARAIFRREYYTVAELEEKATNGEWDKDWVDEVKKTAGHSSQVWDQGLSPVLGSSERIEEKTNLIEVIHAYSRRVTDSGNPGIYMTVFSPYLEKDSRGNEIYAEHKLVTEAGDTYPFETFTREKVRRGVQVSEQRPGDIGWMESPRRGAELAFTLMDHIQLRTDRYFGRPNAGIPPVETQLRQQAYVHRWLRHMSSVIGRIWDLTQVFDTDERFAMVTGTDMPLPRDPKKYNFTLHFDVRELDNEFVEKKLQAISQFVLPEDTMGIVDRTKLIRKKLQVIDPTLADELVIEQAEASQQMFDEMNSP